MYISVGPASQSACRPRGGTLIMLAFILSFAPIVDLVNQISPVIGFTNYAMGMFATFVARCLPWLGIMVALRSRPSRSVGRTFCVVLNTTLATVFLIPAILALLELVDVMRGNADGWNKPVLIAERGPHRIRAFRHSIGVIRQGPLRAIHERPVCFGIALKRDLVCGNVPNGSASSVRFDSDCLVTIATTRAMTRSCLILDWVWF